MIMSADDMDRESISTMLGAKFTTKIQFSSGCWIWVGIKNNYGYGKIRWGGKRLYTHRLAYVAARGAIPDGLVIDHRCGTPACVRPSHLRAVSIKQNLEHMTRLHGRNRSGFRGVSWVSSRKKWYAQLRHDGRNISLGLFDSAEAAAEAAAAGRAKYFTHDDGVLGVQQGGAS